MTIAAAAGNCTNASGTVAGLTKYDQSYADVTSVQPVARVCLLRQHGLLHRSELERIARQLSTYLGL